MDQPSLSSPERIAQLTREHVDVVPYDPRWPALYAEEEARLVRSLPGSLVLRIDHIGSTAVPGLHAKPIIDMQVSVSDLDRVRKEVVPIMTDLAYEFIWRPTMGEHEPFYAWFIKRGADGRRTHHVHMVRPDEATLDRLLFRDLLRSDPMEARGYEDLKHHLAGRFPDDRAAYTQGKTTYIQAALQRARTLRS